MSDKLITVIGAGVVGLSTAIALLDSGFTNVIIVSELDPLSPKSIRYTSQWAGAHHVSVAVESKQHGLDSATFKEMQRLMSIDKDVPLMMLPQIEFRETPYPEGGNITFNYISQYAPDFRRLDASELPEGVKYGVSFKTVYIDTPNYLLYLFDRFKKLGGIHHAFLLSKLSSIFSIEVPTPNGTVSLSTSSVIINCTGIGAYALLGDKDVYPTRGQTVLVRAPWVKFGITRTGPPGSGIYTYIIPRKSGDVIIGGTAEVDDWEPEPRIETSEMIMRRGIELCPELLPEGKRKDGKIEDLDVISFNCGLRPTRKGGVRIEIDSEGLNFESRNVKLISNYGHGGYGYQASWGSAFAAVELVKSLNI